MTDMRLGWLLQGIAAHHNAFVLRRCSALCPPPPAKQRFSNPSWKVIVSASIGQYLKPGSLEPGFFSTQVALTFDHPLCVIVLWVPIPVDSFVRAPHAGAMTMT